MRRALAILAALGAVFAVASGTATGAACSDRLNFGNVAYRSVVTHASIPVGTRLGKGTIRSSCHTTHTATPGGGYSAATANGEPRGPIRRVVYAVHGVRPKVAIAVKSARTTLFVSRTAPTADELEILRRLRGG
jgi:hypothetical protein